MQYFTIVTEIASLISLAIQLFDVFPRFRRQQQSLLFVLVGIFIGSLVRGLDASSIKLDFQPTGLAVLVGFLAVAVVGFLIAAASNSDRVRRSELYGVGGVCAVLIAFICFSAA